MTRRRRAPASPFPDRLSPFVTRELEVVAGAATRAGQSLGPLEVARLVRAITRRVTERSRAGWCWRDLAACVAGRRA